MRVNARGASAIVVLASSLSPNAASGQSSTPAATAASGVVAGRAASQGASQPPPAPTGLLNQADLTGEWGGVRSRWRDKGVVLDTSLTQFYQGVASGGVETTSEYNGTLQAKSEFDLGKLAGWQFWSAEIKGEWRFGGPLVTGTGSISPVNTAAIIPGADGSVFAITALNVTKLFPVNLKQGNLIALSVGRYNLLDLLDEDFFAGGGTDRFLNIAQIGPLTVLRQVPLVTNAINFVYIKGGEPFFTFSLIDPNDHSTDMGIDDLFADGVTFSPGIRFPVKYGGNSGSHSFGGAITTKEYNPFDAIRQIIIPGPPLVPIEPQRGSWSVNYAFRQYIVERTTRDGWGLFTQVSLADRDTSPITTFFDVGIGGNGLFTTRRRDEFGVAYAYTDLSETLKDNLDFPRLGIERVRAEHQLEVFYNMHVTPWLQLTGDVQILRAVRPGVDAATVPGVRLKIVF
jgi:porin